MGLVLLLAAVGVLYYVSGAPIPFMAPTESPSIVGENRNPETAIPKPPVPEPIEHAAGNIVAHNGFSFDWPYGAVSVFERPGKGTVLFEDINLSGPNGDVFDRVECTTPGYFEGPYEVSELQREERTFMHAGREYEISFATYNDLGDANTAPDIAVIRIMPTNTDSETAPFFEDSCSLGVGGSNLDDGEILLLGRVYDSWR